MLALVQPVLPLGSSCLDKYSSALHNRSYYRRPLVSYPLLGKYDVYSKTVPGYSDLWFTDKGRVSATAIACVLQTLISIAKDMSLTSVQITSKSIWGRFGPIDRSDLGN